MNAGFVEYIKGRIMQHRMTLKNKSKLGHCKMLMFYLVDRINDRPGSASTKIGENK